MKHLYYHILFTQAIFNCSNSQIKIQGNNLLNHYSVKLLQIISINTSVETKFLSLCDEIKNITIGNDDTTVKKRKIGAIIYGQSSTKGLLKNKNLMEYIKNKGYKQF